VLNCALAGSSYGQVQVAGSATLNGTLSINLTNNYIPTTNDSFTVLTASTLNGAFANFTYPSSKLSMLMSNTANSVIVFVTGVRPQPMLYLDTISAISGRLYWSTNYPDYHLEYNSILGSPNWAASRLTPVVTGTNFMVTNSLSGAQKYYRLSRVPSTYTPPPPTLELQIVSSGMVRLFWPLDDNQPFVLQSSTNLMSPNWTSVLPLPAIMGSDNVVTNAIDASQRFYRLSGM
jgi:hypothetical protein